MKRLSEEDKLEFVKAQMVFADNLRKQMQATTDSRRDRSQLNVSYAPHSPCWCTAIFWQMVAGSYLTAGM